MRGVDDHASDVTVNPHDGPGCTWKIAGVGTAASYVNSHPTDRRRELIHR
jgi:hypothetical protein